MGEYWVPKVTFVTIARKVAARFFLRDVNKPDAHQNPVSGTVIDKSICTGSELHSFFLISQPVNKGTAKPSQFTVLYDSAHLSVNTLQALTFRLCFLYFNQTCGVRLPAPAMYAKKVAHLVGTSLHAEPHQRLNC